MWHAHEPLGRQCVPIYMFIGLDCLVNYSLSHLDLEIEAAVLVWF